MLIEQARTEVEKCAWLRDHNAEFVDAYLADGLHPREAEARVKTTYEPMGWCSR